ncbi:uncharacterized protein PAC_10351 [Phialocephala subalpina]|uniref:C2H2-type domain-containing protein n=1 Tax=Phialocephala subalpina TaxID=576137 RepID=A0A1L7X628_9HELO|nr:uncharacterized protein PAC_10351 [Phialocephala subalpina]
MSTCPNVVLFQKNDESIANAAHSTPIPISKLPDSLTPYLVLLDEPSDLPVCRECQAAILPKSLLDHLRKHHQLPVELRRDVRSLVAILPPLNFSDMPTRPNDSAPIEVLRVVVAFQCKQCSFIRRDLTDVRKHINKEHKMSAAGSYEEIQAQSWFGGSKAVYWRVCAKEPCRRLIMEISPCVWGLLGRGWGHMQPRNWPREEEQDAELPSRTI